MTASNTLEMTVGQLVVEKPARARAFEQLGIDYCCGGKVPFTQACRLKGLDPAATLALLDQEPGHYAQTDQDWSVAPMSALCDHIEQTHHAYLKEELPRLEKLAAKVVNAHGLRHLELMELRDVLLALKAELESHLAKEELILFPLCRRLDTASVLPAMHCGKIGNPISVMVREHDDAGEALRRLRELSNDYTPPDDACNTYRALLDGLHHLELDLHQHIHKENNILFPRAIEAESRLASHCGE